MRKNLFNNKINMINIKELYFAVNSAKDPEIKKIAQELIYKVDNYTSMKIQGFCVAILDDNYSVKVRKLNNFMKGDFFNTQEYISEADYHMAKSFAESYLNDEQLQVFEKLLYNNITGFKKNIINCCEKDKGIEGVVDFILAVKQYEGTLSRDRAIYYYDGENITLKNSQDPELMDYNHEFLNNTRLTKIYLNDSGSCTAYFDISGCLFETENLMLLPKKGNTEVFVGEVIGENAEYLKQYLDERCIYDDSQLVEYINKSHENVKIYNLK